MSSIVRTPPPTVSGMKQRSAVRSTMSKIVSRLSMTGRDVEKAELVRAGRVIGGRGFDGVARVDQIDEVDALDDAAVLDVEAGNDADFEGHARALARRPGPGKAANGGQIQRQANAGGGVTPPLGEV